MNKKLGAALRSHGWLLFILLAAFSAGAFLMQEYVLGGIYATVTLIAFIIFYLRQHRHRQAVLQFAKTVGEAQTTVKGVESPFPLAVIRMADDMLLYSNNAFNEAADFAPGLAEQKLTELVPELTTDWLTSGNKEFANSVTIGGRRYRVYGSAVRADDPGATLLGIVYFADLTELYQIRDEYIRSRPVVSIILVDNYDELTAKLTEGAISTMHARINDVITRWTDSVHGLLRRIEKNRFLFIFEKCDLQTAVEKKFTVLEEIHQITNATGLAASLSIGLGVDGANFEESYKFASLALEMALSRGGDQAVVKDRLNFSFYGGRSKENEQRSKVRSRVTASLLMELIGQSSQVFVMGHRMADLDAVGAAVGVCCMCRKKGKKFSIVLDENYNAAGKLIEQLKALPEYADAFISAQQAVEQCDAHSILVVVDTNRPDQVESPELLATITKVCVIDHHRRAADYIDPVVVNLHEPYASSAAELVTELLQYAVESTDVLEMEAIALLSGIFLDTKSFHVRTGERTFEAAAYLRQLGAETVEVKNLLKTDLAETKVRHAIIQAARPYKDEIAISVLDRAVTRVQAAQAADELLNVSGITASVVMYPENGQVIISARSIGSVNVQVLLEGLGGGGNAATAGAQIKDISIKDVLAKLLAAIDKYYE